MAEGLAGGQGVGAENDQPPTQQFPSSDLPLSLPLLPLDLVADLYPPEQLNLLSPIALAYIGDAVYELFVRLKLLLPPRRLHDYHRQVVAQVRAEHQAWCLEHIAPHLNEFELQLVRRGRNSTKGSRNRRLDPKIYQQATGFEALVGYLYLSDRSRLLRLLALLSSSPQSPV